MGEFSWGFGTALVLKVKASTGGTDLVTYLVKEYNPIYRPSSVIIIMDTIIVLLNVIFFRQIEIGLYSAITIYIMGNIIDIIFEGIYFTKLIFIISDKTEKIAEQIGQKIPRGTTGLYGKRMYTQKETTILLCAASRGDVIRIKELAKEIDSNAFIIIANSREVFGKGFKTE